MLANVQPSVLLVDFEPMATSRTESVEGEELLIQYKTNAMSGGCAERATEKLYKKLNFRGGGWKMIIPPPPPPPYSILNGKGLNRNMYFVLQFSNIQQ